MGIELGSIGSAIGNAASAVGGVVGSVGRGVESGPSMGSVIVNEGPVGASFLEHTMPYTLNNFNPRGEILFNPIQEGSIVPMTVPDVVAQAEGVAAQAWTNPLPEQEVAVYWFTDVSELVVKPADVLMPQAEPKPATIVEPFGNWDNHVITQAENVVKTSQVAPTIFSQPALQKQEIEEIVREEIIVEKPGDVVEEEKEMKKKKHLVDYPVLARVLFELREAYEKGEKEARRLGKKLFGPMLARLLPGQHEGNTGGAVKPHGVDGTISARKEVLAAKKEIRSLEEAVEVVSAIRPVTIGEEGELARREEVDTTYRDYIVKPYSVTEVVEKRIKKKGLVSAGQITPLVVNEETKNKQEASLEDFPVLTGVFPKAA